MSFVVGIRLMVLLNIAAVLIASAATAAASTAAPPKVHDSLEETCSLSTTIESIIAFGQAAGLMQKMEGLAYVRWN